jgi:hypothetical protein
MINGEARLYIGIKADPEIEPSWNTPRKNMISGRGKADETA